ncbi:hypothetical protein [Pseudomonas mosselii]|uniref:hypothetical protein n=1 Tax=Pseudomonas mosselii TaxID=78327 RepID=UPI002022E462|nr:hypothetical protein [Pseudomonas mosselii]MCL8302160.1 hypothetical protein [Pseudomonas mosselii]
MTVTKTQQANPFDNLREALNRLRTAHEHMQMFEEELAKARNKINGLLIDLQPIYSEAVAAAEKLGETLPSDFMDGQIRVQFSDDHEAKVTHFPYMETFMLLSLADRIKEKDTPSE